MAFEVTQPLSERLDEVAGPPTPVSGIFTVSHTVSANEPQVPPGIDPLFWHSTCWVFSTAHNLERGVSGLAIRDGSAKR